MGQREKQFEAMQNNPREVKFNELVALLEWLGYVKKQGSKQSHYTFTHPLIRSSIRVAEDHGNRIDAVYVRKALAEIEKYPILWERRKT